MHLPSLGAQAVESIARFQPDRSKEEKPTMTTNRTTFRVPKNSILSLALILALTASCAPRQGTPTASLPTEVVPVHPGTIAFARIEQGTCIGVMCAPLANLYVIHTDGTGLTQLTHETGTSLEHPAWSPDGTMIAYDSGYGWTPTPCGL